MKSIRSIAAWQRSVSEVHERVNYLYQQSFGKDRAEAKPTEESGVRTTEVFRQKLHKHFVYDQEAGRVTTQLQFRQKATSSRFTNAAAAPVNAAFVSVHRETRQYDDENAGVEAANSGKTTAATSVRSISSARRKRADPYRSSVTAKPNLRGLNAEGWEQKTQAEYPGSNPVSRMAQKRRLKKEYAAAKAGKTVKSASNTAKEARKGADNTAKASEKAAAFAIKHRKGIAVIIALTLTVCFLTNTVTSCASIAGSACSEIFLSTYQAEDAEILGAEAAYCDMETELQQSLDSYETEHNYDEYRFELDDIGHDPYVLISIVSSLHKGAWTVNQTESTLKGIFDRQYNMTEDVQEEIRTRTVTQTRTRTVTDPETGEEYEEEYEAEVEEEYTYATCAVTLENFDLSHLPVYIMSEEQLEIYATYMACLGNRPDLFLDSAYIGRYGAGNYLDYTIPTEALEDERFAAMMEEATKHLGRPYVWGGSSPGTSFDCSGFVSWVINHSGWNVGRLGAQGLCNICTMTSTPHPGDLVFFVGTYDTDGVSHVGIYVGNNMMIHCGDPISYADLTSDYWQQHFYCYGRLPTP